MIHSYGPINCRPGIFVTITYGLGVGVGLRMIWAGTIVNIWAGAIVTIWAGSIVTLTNGLGVEVDLGVEVGLEVAEPGLGVGFGVAPDMLEPPPWYFSVKSRLIHPLPDSSLPHFDAPWPSASSTMV